MVVVKSEIRQDIIQVARRIFTRTGYRKTTMEQIAKASGMGKSSLYYYYKSKEEIFEAVVVKEAKELKREMERVVKKGSTPMEQLKDYIMFRLYNVKTMSNFHAVLKEDFPEQLRFVNRIRSKFEEEEYKLVHHVLEQGIKEGSFILKGPKIGATAFITLLKGLEVPLFLNKYTRAQKEEVLDDLLQVIFYGIVAR